MEKNSGKFKKVLSWNSVLTKELDFEEGREAQNLSILDILDRDR